MTAPTDQPDVLLFGLCCIAIFCFYSFPMVIFSWLLTPALDFGPCRRFKVTNSALVSESRAVWPVPAPLVTWFMCCLCRQWGGQRRGAAYVNWPSLSSTNPKANPLAWVRTPECSTPVWSVPGPTISAPPLPLCRARELGCKIAEVSPVLTSCDW